MQGRITSSKEENWAQSWTPYKNDSTDNSITKIFDKNVEDSAQRLLRTSPFPSTTEGSATL